MLAEKGVTNIAMDFTNSIERAYTKNEYSRVHFIEGDIQFPPLVFDYFDIVEIFEVPDFKSNSNFMLKANNEKNVVTFR